MYIYPILRPINIDETSALVKARYPSITGISVDDVSAVCHSNTELSIVELLDIQDIVTINNTKHSLILRVQAAIRFGEQLLAEFAAENILLGITTEGKTGEVLTKLSVVQQAVMAGSLYEAIDRIRAIPMSDYDNKYITGARLLKFVNKLEDYLGVPKSDVL